jgi:hypothetical protein
MQQVGDFVVWPRAPRDLVPKGTVGQIKDFNDMKEKLVVSIKGHVFLLKAKEVVRAETYYAQEDAKVQKKVQRDCQKRPMYFFKRDFF